METLPGFEVVRAVAPRAMVTRSQDDGAMPTMEVRFSAFGRWYEIDSFWEGRFLERTERGAFAKTIKESADRVKVLFNHGFDPSVGQKVLGSIADLREDPDSPVGVVPLFDTAYNRDLLPGLEAGVYGSSMRMRVIKEEWNDEPGRSDHNPDGIPERTITEIRLMEFGPVTFPANPDSTAGVRSLTDDYYDMLRAQNPAKVEDLLRARELRTPPTRAAAEGTAQADGAARTTTAQPPAGHSSGLTAAQRRERIFLLQKG